jgi:EAL domain-containing protein (putative c-di-GMP-specific phosphodiesterase class I)
VCLETGQVLGAEALLRWQHPERGLVFPGEFIDTVEASDMAIELGSWVIDQAIAQAASWQRFAPAGGTLKMSLNVAPRQLAHVDFVNTVVGALDRHGVPAEAVVLEITERMLAGKEPQIVQAMSQLQELGVRLAVDDFGTGYSSLGYLRRFPVSTLKIDRSFVQGLGQSPDDHALVEAIVRLAQTFDLDLVAEGVETEEQRAALRRMGCQGGQGYLYSRAVPADVAEVYLAAHAAIELPHPIAALH